MAVYTEVGDEELDDFVAEYDIGSVLSCKGIAEGVENSNYMLHTDAGTYILTLYEKRVARADLPFFLGLMHHLAEAGIRCPTPVPRRDRQPFGELAGRPAAIVSFLEGVWHRRPQPKHCAEVGRAMAAMHIAGGSFELRRDNALTVAGWRPLYDACGKYVDQVLSGLSNEIETELDLFDTAWPTELPSGVIHADLFPDNVFFLRDELSGLIDFYFACNDTLAYDVAICLNAWCFEVDGAFNITKARALLSGYNAVRHFEPSEFDALPILCRGSALRFLLTRLHDWIHQVDGALVKPKDPIEYLKRLRFHRTARDAGAYGLDR